MLVGAGPASEYQSVMQPEPPLSPVTLDYEPGRGRRRGKPWLALALTAPTGVGAGVVVYYSGPEHLRLLLALFSLCCPLALGLLAGRLQIPIGLIACGIMCSTAFALDLLKGRPFDPSEDLGLWIMLVVLTGLGSLLVSLPLTMLQRQAA
jgi:hypothetical protein